MNKFIILAVLIAVCNAAERPYPSPPAHPKIHYGMPYNFDWTVKDKPSYNDFGQQESSDGKVVTGSYFVALPDGRVQTVDYKVEGESGFVADVKYKGEAKYHKPAKKY